jgi:hypothetical protein
MQAWRDSNPQPTNLESVALPVRATGLSKQKHPEVKSVYYTIKNFKNKSFEKISNSDIKIIGMRNKRKGKGRGASAEGQ